MKIKTLAKVAVFGLGCLMATGLAGCGNDELVSFGQYSGTYQGKTYSVAASQWEKQEDEESFDGVYKLVGEVKYDDQTGKTLYYGDADTKYFVAITINHEDGIMPQDSTFQIEDRTLKVFDNGNPNTFTLIKSISQETKDFTLTIKWNSDTTVKYKFVIDKDSFTLEEV